MNANQVGQIIENQTISADIIVSVNNVIIRKNNFINGARVVYTAPVDGGDVLDNNAVGNTGDFVRLGFNLKFTGSNYALKNIRILRNKIDKGAIFMGGFGSPYSDSNFLRNVEIAYNERTSASDGPLITATMSFWSNWHHNKYVCSTQSLNGGDYGIINVNGGNGLIYSNYRSGGWGWGMRVFACSVIGDETDFVAFNNIDLNHTEYGNVDMRSEPLPANISFIKPTNIRAFNNTSGNLWEDLYDADKYSNAVVLVANIMPGFEFEVKNNLSFNVETKGYKNVELGVNSNVGAFGGVNLAQGKVSNNKYYATYLLAGLVDDVNCVPKANSPVIDAGAPVPVGLDYLGNTRPQGAAFDIGAVEFIAINQAPTAKIGQPAAITLPINSIVIDGSGSSDPDGSVIAYQWSISPAANKDTSISGKMSLSNLSPGTYAIGLAVTDNGGVVSPLVQSILTVNPAPNALPVPVEADVTIILPTNAVELDATGSSDSDGTVVNFGWLQQAGPNTAIITRTSTGKAVASNLIAGVYNILLSIIDNNGGVARKNVFIIVKPAPFIVGANVDLLNKKVSITYNDGTVKEIV